MMICGWLLKAETQVCDRVYEVLEKFMEGESEKSDRYVAKYVPFFQTQLGFALTLLMCIG